MSNIKDISKEYLSYQLSVIPTTADKLPALYSWEDLQHKILSKEEIDILFKGGSIRPEIEREITKKDKTKFTAKGIKSFIEPVGIGIITGAISGSLEVIDVDTKYDITGSLWDELKALIEGNLPEIYNSLVIAQTKSGGYHIYYKCSQIGRNDKLANRFTTDQERAIHKNEKIKVLIETRGEGGYVIAPPTTGYKYIQGEPGNIPTITPQQRDILFSIAKSFNEVEEEKPKEKPTTNNIINSNSSTSLSPFEDYYNRGDVVSFLESKGWTVVNEQGNRVNLKRPGQTDTKNSGNYHTDKRLLRVFSSSTEFDIDKAYTPTEVFILLECNGDKKEAYKKLLALGYGEPYTTDKKDTNSFKTNAIKVDKVNNVNRVTSVISTPGDILNSDSISIDKGEDIVINSPGSEAKDEVLKAINVLSKTGSKIYINEGGVELISYRYQLHSIINKYEALRLQIGVLTDREINNLQEDIIETASKLQPLDKDQFLKEFLDNGGGKDLGITEESLAITVDKLTTTRDKEAQAKDFKKLLTEVTALQDKGEVDKALNLLDSRVKDVKLKDKATEFNSLLLPIKETELRERLTNKPDSLKSGYSIGGEELLLPAGAISILTAPTSHGKTTFLLNLALNVAQEYKDKEAYFFSYEEDSDSVLISALSIYLNNPISLSNRTTYKNHFSGKNKSTIENKESFFNELIDTRRLNINYTTYNSDTLIEAIRYLHKNTNIGSVFIDYIQLLNLPQGKYKTYSRQEEIKEICIALKDLAVETGLPIILGAQFNRTVLSPLDLHATKIGEAGDIERVASLILGFWNNSFAPLTNTAGEGNSLNELLNKLSTPGLNAKESIYIKILKQRAGRVGAEELLSFNGNTGKIKNHLAEIKNEYFNTPLPDKSKPTKKSKQLIIPEEEPIDKAVECSKCGVINPLDFLSCKSCGEPINKVI